MTKKKHSLLAIVSCLLLLAMAIGFTSLYLTDNDTATNTVTVGDVKIDLLEPNWTDTNDVVPNQELTKDPQIKNVGINDAVVFMTVEVPIENITIVADDGTKGTKGNSELFWFKDSADSASTHANNFDSNWVHLDTRDTGANLAGATRTYVFAYKTPISNNETTTALFDKIQVKNFIENEIPAGKTEQIKINAYGIQASEVLESGVDLTDTLSNANLDKIYGIFIKQAFNQASPELQDLTYNVENDYVKTYMAAESYNPSDTTYTNIVVPSSRLDHPGEGELSVPDGAESITITSSVDGKSFTDELSGSTYAVKNLIPGVSYSYNMKDSSNNVVKTGTITPTGQVRMITVGDNQAGSRNVRDFGGWTADGGTFKYGVLYRGAELDGINYGNAIINEDQKDFFENFLGIGAELDLRAASQSNQTASLNNVNYLFTNNMGQYTDFERSSGVTSAFHFIAQNLGNNTPTYIHCMAGADRTGTISALIEAICGVSESDIDRDYELSLLALTNGDNASYYANGTYQRTSANWNSFKQLLKNIGKGNIRNGAIYSLVNMGITLEEINIIRDALIDGSHETITDAIFNGTEVFDQSSALIGYRINSSGSPVAAESWSISTDYIPCQKGDVFCISSDRALYKNGRYNGCTYDSSNAKLSNVWVTDGVTRFVFVVTDNNADKVRFTVPADDINNISIKKL